MLHLCVSIFGLSGNQTVSYKTTQVMQCGNAR